MNEGQHFVCIRALGTVVQKTYSATVYLHVCQHVSLYLLCCFLLNLFLSPNQKRTSIDRPNGQVHAYPTAKKRFVKVELGANETDRIFYGFHCD